MSSSLPSGPSSPRSVLAYKSLGSSAASSAKGSPTSLGSPSEMAADGASPEQSHLVRTQQQAEGAPSEAHLALLSSLSEEVARLEEMLQSMSPPVSTMSSPQPEFLTQMYAADSGSVQKLENEVSWLQTELRAMQLHLRLLEAKSTTSQLLSESNESGRHGDASRRGRRHLKNHRRQRSSVPDMQRLEVLHNLRKEIQKEVNHTTEYRELQKSQNDKLEGLLSMDPEELSLLSPTTAKFLQSLSPLSSPREASSLRSSSSSSSSSWARREPEMDSASPAAQVRSQSAVLSPRWPSEREADSGPPVIDLRLQPRGSRLRAAALTLDKEDPLLRKPHKRSPSFDSSSVTSVASPGGSLGLSRQNSVGGLLSALQASASSTRWEKGERRSDGSTLTRHSWDQSADLRRASTWHEKVASEMSDGSASPLSRSYSARTLDGGSDGSDGDAGTARDAGAAKGRSGSSSRSASGRNWRGKLAGLLSGSKSNVSAEEDLDKDRERASGSGRLREQKSGGRRGQYEANLGNEVIVSSQPRRPRSARLSVDYESVREAARAAEGEEEGDDLWSSKEQRRRLTRRSSVSSWTPQLEEEGGAQQQAEEGARRPARISAEEKKALLEKAARESHDTEEDTESDLEGPPEAFIRLPRRMSAPDLAILLAGQGGRPSAEGHMAPRRHARQASYGGGFEDFAPEEADLGPEVPWRGPNSTHAEPNSAVAPAPAADAEDMDERQWESEMRRRMRRRNSTSSLETSLKTETGLDERDVAWSSIQTRSRRRSSITILKELRSELGYDTPKGWEGDGPDPDAEGRHKLSPPRQPPSSSSAVAFSSRASQPLPSNVEYPGSYAGRPNELSEELVRCIASVYERLAARSSSPSSAAGGLQDALGNRGAGAASRTLAGLGVAYRRPPNHRGYVGASGPLTPTSSLYDRRCDDGDRDPPSNHGSYDFDEPKNAGLKQSFFPSPGHDLVEGLRSISESPDADGQQSSPKPGGSGPLQRSQSGGPGALVRKQSIGSSLLEPDKGSGSLLATLGLRRTGSASLNPDTGEFPLGKAGETSPTDPYGVLRDHPLPSAGDYADMVVVTTTPTSEQRDGADVVALCRYQSLVEQLESVNPGRLTHEQSLAFWLNIYNALIMHTYTVHGRPQTFSKRVSLMSKAIFKVGRHPFSALDMEYAILRACSHRSTQVAGGSSAAMRLLGGRRSAARFPMVSKFEASDERAAWALKKPEPLVSFALCPGAHSGPALRIYTAANVREELEFAKMMFLLASVGISRSGKIMLPKILEWYGRDFVSEDSKLGEWVANQLPEPQRGLMLDRIFQHKRQSSTKGAEVVPFDWSFRYLIEPFLSRSPVPRRNVMKPSHSFSTL